MLFRHLAVGLALAALVALPASAQGQSAETRPGSTTFLGDTGLWFVPTGEVLPAGKISVSAYRVNFDRTEASSDISDFAGTFAVGLGNRAELFASISPVRRLHSLNAPPRSQGTPVDYPLINDRWQQGLGDMHAGVKVNLASQGDGRGAAVALRGVFRIPSADTDKGLGTGKPAFLLDGIVSSEVGGNVELSGYAGVAMRGSPDDVTLTSGLRYGFGLSAPTRGSFRIFAELTGEQYFDSTLRSNQVVAQVFPPPAIAFPTSWDVDSPLDAFFGLQYQSAAGMFVGAGVSAGLNTDKTDGSRLGVQVRLGYHPGVRIYAPVPPPPPPPPPPANRPPTVKARCEPCTIEIGKAITVTADAQDPDGDTLTYRWSGPTGTFANAGDRQTQWTAPMQEGAVPLTVTVDDGRGGTASDTVTIQVVRPPRREYNFEDVHFDFDRYTLRAEATRLLDDAVKAMQEDPSLRLTLEGHTCNIGTAEYNLALGERRATAVRDYLVSRGISADRLQTVSYGEERPRHDNAREETRRLNRRTALTIRMQ
jgi:outer membrane protein OmpA-like peptidoglycan-associated protein